MGTAAANGTMMRTVRVGKSSAAAVAAARPSIKHEEIPSWTNPNTLFIRAPAPGRPIGSTAMSARAQPAAIPGLRMPEKQ
jgi:hypothetical protein